MTAKVRVDPHSGVFAHAALKAGAVRERLDHLRLVRDRPPSATLDTTHSPLLAISGRVELLGITDSIDVGVGSAGSSST